MAGNTRLKDLLTWRTVMQLLMHWWTFQLLLESMPQSSTHTRVESLTVVLQHQCSITRSPWSEWPVNIGLENSNGVLNGGKTATFVSLVTDLPVVFAKSLPTQSDRLIHFDSYHFDWLIHLKTQLINTKANLSKIHQEYIRNYYIQIYRIPRNLINQLMFSKLHECW